MLRLLRIAALAALLATPALAQGGPSPVTSVPVVRGTPTTSLPASCLDGTTRWDSTANVWKRCSSNSWVVAAVPTTRQVTAGTGLSGGGALSSDVTLSLPSVGTAGTYGDTSHIPQITTDAQGRVSGVSLASITTGTTYPRQAVSSSATALIDHVVTITGVSGNFTLTLPSASGQATHWVWIVDESEAVTAGIVAVAPATGEAIGNLSADYRALIWKNRQQMLLVSDGTGWRVEAGGADFVVDPRSISGLKVWYAADRGVTLNGRNVSAWADLSGNGYGTAQATSAQQPPFTPSWLNGRPALKFSSGAGTMLVSSASATLSSGGVSVFAVLARPDWTAGGSKDVLTIGNMDFAVCTGTVDIYAAPNIAVWLNGYSVAPRATANQVQNVPALLANTTHIITAQAGSASYVRIDGTDWTINGGAATGSSTTGVVTVSGGGSIDGYISEIGVIDVLALSATDRGFIETYLHRKYGI